MGTDIHMYVERRASTDAPWETADRWSETEYGTQCKHIFGDRSYDTFAILADVRNGSGFAGVRTGDGFVPISEPRGLPSDMSPELAAHLAEGIEHTPSWLTLADIQQYDWTQTTRKSGIVDLSELARWKQRGRPEMWSGGIGGPGIGIVDATDAVPVIEDALSACSVIAHGQSRAASWWDLYHSEENVVIDVTALLQRRFGFQRPHFLVTWKVSYADAASEFLWKVVPRLWRLGEPENVRLVFYFDS